MTSSLNRTWDEFILNVSEKLGIRDPLGIMPYRGYGTADWIIVKGRVLEKEGIQLLPKDAPIWKNVLNMYRRFETDEVPNAKVEVRYGDCKTTVTADKEGFFEAELRPERQLCTDELWQSVSVELVDPPPRKQEKVVAECESIIVSPKARFGVISDVDDTVAYTAAKNPIKMVRISYLGNAHSRKTFEGVEDFYQALQAGKDGEEDNPIFYVSSSPWNMYDLFDKFMSINEIPNGPILLRDIELSPANLLSFSHQGHKREQIEPLFKRFPDLSFILIGDSGQKDPEIYKSLVKDYPDRISGVYIRHAVPDNHTRTQEVEQIGEDIRTLGATFLFFLKTEEAAKHAASQGWIESAEVSSVEADTSGVASV